MKRVLVTGFEPFGGRKRNVSSAALEGLQGMEGVHTEVLPVEFGRAAFTAIDHAKHGGFDEVLALGEMPMLRSAVRFEERGRNMAYALALPDNAGQRKLGRLDAEEKRLVLPASMQYDALQKTLDELDVRTRRSRKAGTFVCNSVLFGLLRAQRTGELSPDVSIGFVHMDRSMSDEKAQQIVRRMTTTLRR